MKHFLKKILTSLVFTGALFAGFAAAQKNPAGEMVLIDNERHYAAYRSDDENVVLTFELIDDFTDDTRGDFPNIDFVGFNVDFDQNSEITEKIDRLYGVTGKPTWIKKDWSKEPFVAGICTSYLITASSATGCGKFKSRATLDFGFRPSEKHPVAHPVFIFTVPRTELFAGGSSARIRIRMYNAGRGFAVYPAMERGEKYNSLAKTLSLEF